MTTPPIAPVLNAPMSDIELSQILKELGAENANNARRIGAPGSDVREQYARRASGCWQAAARLERWWEIWKDEMAETLRLADALGIVDPTGLPAGTTLMQAMLARIAFLKSCELKCCGSNP